MAALIKNQILKHLSRFAKNLSSDKLQLSTLKGHCELQNLELDENVLMDLMELPLWLRLTQAICNHVVVKIHWTKLKSVPIFVSLDEVLVEMETCETLRPMSTTQSRPTHSSGGKYGFSDRVVDGMTVAVNSVVINFNSPVFVASFQISRLLLESRNPTWKKDDLRMSRIKSPERGEVLIFKQLEWQVLRIEAKGTENSPGHSPDEVFPLTPLRLITNQACCRLILKKKLSDCSIVGSRMIVILDDLLWVLTDGQLIAALHFLQSLGDLVQQATYEARKVKAARKLAAQPDTPQQGSKTKSSSSSHGHMTPLGKAFGVYDVVETSCHIYSGKIDLHLCDEFSPQGGLSGLSSLKEGGALQVSLYRLSLDYYPYHHILGSREHWLKYSEPSTARSAWIQQLLTLFQERLSSITSAPLESSPVTDTARTPAARHTPLHRAPPTSLSNGPTPVNSIGPPGNSVASQDTDTSRRSSQAHIRKTTARAGLKLLMSCCTVVRLENFVVYNVSTASSVKKKAQDTFVGSDRSFQLLNGDVKAVHLETTYYYFPGNVDLPVPAPNTYVHFGPLQIKVDPPTILWLNAFLLNLKKYLVPNKTARHAINSCTDVDVRAEALMPKVVFPSGRNAPSYAEKPKALYLQTTRLVATNCRIGEYASCRHLNLCLEDFGHGSLFFDTDQYPWRVEDCKPIAERFVRHSLGQDTETREERFVGATGTSQRQWMDLRWPAGHDVWSIHLDPCWAEFSDCMSSKGKPQAFVDPLPLTLWFYEKKLPDQMPARDTTFAGGCQNGLRASSDGPSETSRESVQSDGSLSREADRYLLVHVHSVLNVQLDRYQLLFLLQEVDTLLELTAQLQKDTLAFEGNGDVPVVCITTLCQSIDVSLVLGRVCRQQETSFSPQQDEELGFRDQSSLFPKMVLSTQSSVSETDLDSQGRRSLFGSAKNVSERESNKVSGGVPKSCSDSMLDSHSSASTGSVSPPLSSQDIPSTLTEKSVDSLQKGVHSGATMVRKGFGNLMANLDSIISKGSGDHPVPGEADRASSVDDDSLSMRSDFSSDSDQFTMVGFDSATAEDDLFRTHQHPDFKGVEEADEVKEDPAGTFGSTDQSKLMVSVLTLRLENVQFVCQSQGCDSLILVQTNHIETVDRPAMSWSEFQASFLARARGWSPRKVESGNPNTRISLRVEQGPRVCQFYRDVDDLGHIGLLVQNLNLRIRGDTLASLARMFEDETKPANLPATILAESVTLCLQNDAKPDVASTSVPPPVRLNIPGCLVEKKKDGNIYVNPLPAQSVGSYVNLLLGNLVSPSTDSSARQNSYIQSSASLNNLFVLEPPPAPVPGERSAETADYCESRSLDAILSENESLRRKLTGLLQMKKENELLKQQLNLMKTFHGDRLKDQLLEAQDDVRRLEEEKQSLQATLQLLQEELSRAEIINHKRVVSLDAGSNRRGTQW